MSNNFKRLFVLIPLVLATAFATFAFPQPAAAGWSCESSWRTETISTVRTFYPNKIGHQGIVYRAMPWPFYAEGGVITVAWASNAQSLWHTWSGSTVTAKYYEQSMVLYTGSTDVRFQLKFTINGNQYVQWKQCTGG